MVFRKLRSSWMHQGNLIHVIQMLLVLRQNQIHHKVMLIRFVIILTKISLEQLQDNLVHIQFLTRLKTQLIQSNWLRNWMLKSRKITACSSLSNGWNVVLNQTWMLSNVAGKVIPKGFIRVLMPMLSLILTFWLSMHLRIKLMMWLTANLR